MQSVFTGCSISQACQGDIHNKPSLTPQQQQWEGLGVLAISSMLLLNVQKIFLLGPNYMLSLFYNTQINRMCLLNAKQDKTAPHSCMPLTLCEDHVDRSPGRGL